MVGGSCFTSKMQQCLERHTIRSLVATNHDINVVNAERELLDWMKREQKWVGVNFDHVALGVEQ